MSGKPETLLLIDGFGYLYRAHHAAPDLRAKDGRASGAIFVILAMMEKLRKRHPANRLACVMDSGGKTFRHELDPQYKATRPPLPPELREQLPAFAEFMRAWGVPQIAAAGVEADDLIAAAAKSAVAAGMQVVVASADKDLMQLVDDDKNIVVYDGMRDKTYNAAAVREKFGVAPAQMADYLALVGDSSDNIPGVVKVGAKTAAKWLNEYGSLPALLAASAKIGGVVGGNLRQAQSSGRLQLSRQLVELKSAAPLPLPVSQLCAGAPNAQAWRRLCEEWGFRRLQNVGGGAAEAAPAPPAPEAAASAAPQCLGELSQLRQWIDKIRAAGKVAVDTETDGETPPMRAALVGFSLAVGDESCYVPLAHKSEAPQILQDDAMRLLAPVLQDEGIVKIFHNGKYDWHIFANAGAPPAGLLEDTKIAAYVADASAANTLKELAAARLDWKMTDYKTATEGKASFAETALPQATAYAAADALATWRLANAIVLSPKQKTVYEELDRPLMPLLARMERAGVLIDKAALAEFSAVARAQMEALAARAEALAGEAFNINSPRQLERVLFDVLGAKPLRKTGGGKRSTDVRALEALARDYPLAAVAHEHRQWAKLAGTYADKLPLLALPPDGRIHTTFTQTAVVTGRLSSASPNLQNIPIRTEAGRKIRRAFVAAPGHCLLSADYSQIELRVMAHMANDNAMLRAFADGADIHRQTAAEVFGVLPAEVGGEARRAAKAINFGLIYGMTEYGLARALDVEPQRAQEYIAAYFARYPQVAEFMRQTRAAAKAGGDAHTIFGRRIPLGAPRGGRQALERFAINAPIQGSAADLVKKAMLNVDRQLRARNMRSRLILQVHDELVLEAANDEAEFLQKNIGEWMNIADLRAPLAVNAQCGQNWDDAH